MTTVEPADYVLGPATRLLWRSPDSIHLELGSREVIVDGVPARAIGRVASTRIGAAGGQRAAAPEPLEGLVDDQVDEQVTDVFTDLVDAGFLWARDPCLDDDTGHPLDTIDDRRVPPTPRLTGELTSLAAQHGERAAELLAARRHAQVLVQGDGRIAAHLAALLAAAGVGRVHCAAAGTVRLSHSVPGGVHPSDEGHDLAGAADAAIRRSAPDTNTDPLPIGERADLTVLAVDAPVDEIRRAALHADRAPHLVVAVGVDHGVVGPLVIPGLTSCLRCADLHRRDRDPAWSALAAQLTVGRRYGPSSDLAVDTSIVGTAAIQILTFLDGGDPACVEGTLELRLPDWRLRRRSRPVHADCGCCDE